MSTCVIFDIDGTLVDSTEFNDRLYGAAVSAVLGAVRVRANWHDYEHVTDSGVLRQLCMENGLDAEVLLPQVRSCFGAMVAEYLGRQGACASQPGALTAFGTLCNDARFQVGIATGGWEHTARLKLDAAGFTTTGVPLTSADDHEQRARILALCRSRLRAATARTVYIGDGEWDQRASAALGWEFIGVGERLRGRCAQWLADFSPGSLTDLLLR